MIAFKAEYAGGELQPQEEEISDAQFFKFDQLPEIPFKGSIAHAMIMHVTQGTAVSRRHQDLAINLHSKDLAQRLKKESRGRSSTGFFFIYCLVKPNISIRI